MPCEAVGDAGHVIHQSVTVHTKGRCRVRQKAGGHASDSASCIIKKRASAPRRGAADHTEAQPSHGRCEALFFVWIKRVTLTYVAVFGGGETPQAPGDGGRDGCPPSSPKFRGAR